MLFRSRSGISSFLVTPGEPMHVGRRPPESPRSVRVKDRLISRNHFRVSLVDDGVLVVDTESTSGTEVNGERIRERIVRVGDVVKINASVIYDVCPPGETLAERIAEGPLGALPALRLLRPVMWHLTRLRYDHEEFHDALDATQILISDLVDVIDHGVAVPEHPSDVVALGTLLGEAMGDTQNPVVQDLLHERTSHHSLLFRWDRAIADLAGTFVVDEPHTWFAVRDAKIVAALRWWGAELIIVVASDANLPGLALQMRARFTGWMGQWPRTVGEATYQSPTAAEVQEFFRVTLPALGPGISLRPPSPSE